MKVTYKNDIADYKSFLYYTALIQERKFRNILIYSIMAVALFIAGFISILCKISGFGSLAIYLSAGLTALDLFMIYKVVAPVKRSLKKMPTVAADFLYITNEYEFLDDRFIVTSKNARTKKKKVTELEYSTILKGVERKDIVYLYLYPNVALMYKKSQYAGEEDLIAFLKNKLGDKFKCNKKAKRV